ncbi:hypothetical protein PLEOSDRAFT_163253 [Pleurotus ostreatus PC15]|uniref:G-protein coupled receptors family 2 profile 2 domain-containing protein n=1 Tax=Pleurotus ostreatus (strain PC15) TaxID=1137138 RepID=A0A067NF45_PLEO1|nr:hypothetical protein PLEOSDRAFT_163253 [Pleurotus ostreatus PC15]
MFLAHQWLESRAAPSTSFASLSWKLPMRDKALTRVFMAMQLFGWAGYTVIIWTVFLSRKIHRHPAWIMFCLAWLISCVSYVLLFLAGEMDSDHPNGTLCLVQACLIYAVPVLTASATLALIIHLWFNVRTVVFHIETQHARTRDFLLCLFPYIPALSFFFGVLWYGLENPKDVKPGDSCMYCVVGASFPGKASAIYVALILAAGVGIEVVIATTLYNNWRSYTRNSKDSFALIIRVVLFTAFGFMSIVISLVYLSHSKHGAVPDVFMGLRTSSFSSRRRVAPYRDAHCYLPIRLRWSRMLHGGAVPVFSFFIFGTQLDLIYAWFPCLRPPAPGAPFPHHKATASLVAKPLLHGDRPMTISTFGTQPSMATQNGWRRADGPEPSPAKEASGLRILVAQRIPIQPQSPSRVSPVMIIPRKWSGAVGLERERVRPADTRHGHYAHLPSEEGAETFAAKVARGRTI